MQFKIKKELTSGRYFVRVELSDYSDADKEKVKIFGEPTLIIKYTDGREIKGKISAVSAFPPFGFYTQQEADQYVESLKLQISELKKNWDTLKDSWSNEEIL
jgi:hypothetical protein